jgi:hypothetical protein
MRSCVTLNLHYLLTGCQIKDDELGGSYIVWEMRNAYKILVGKPERKRPLRRHKHRWEVWSGFIWPRIESSAGCCDHNNETLGSNKR